MSDRTPWLKFYPADWQADPGLRACSPAARGVWMDCLALMHSADPYGHLLLNGAKPSTKMLSGLFNVHHKTLIACMKELQEHGVYSETKDGVIYSRRMVRDHEKALQDKANGKRGGNPRLKADGPEGVNPTDNGGLKAQKPEARSQIDAAAADAGASTRDWRGLIARMQAALGAAFDPTAIGTQHVGELRGLLEPEVGAPCIEADLIEAAQLLGAQLASKNDTLRSWSLITKLAIRIRDRRLAGLPDPVQPEPSHAHDLRTRQRLTSADVYANLAARARAGA